MKLMILLVALFALFLTSGCEEHEHHHHGYGGAYEGYYQGYDYDRDRYFDHEYREHH